MADEQLLENKEYPVFLFVNNYKLASMEGGLIEREGLLKSLNFQREVFIKRGLTSRFTVNLSTMHVFGKNRGIHYASKNENIILLKGAWE